MKAQGMCIDSEKPIARHKSLNLFMPTVNINQVLLLSRRPVFPSKAALSNMLTGLRGADQDCSPSESRMLDREGGIEWGETDK